MANTPYENYVLENKFEDQMLSYLDLLNFCTVDTSLTTHDGMKKMVRIYKATNGTEQVAQGVGNTLDIGVNYYEKTYDIMCLQNRFPYFDEEVMKDHLILDKGLNHQAVDMYNTMNNLVMTELLTGQDVDDQGQPIAIPSKQVTSFDFGAFVDGAGLLTAVDVKEKVDQQDLGIFAIVHPDDVKEIRKNLATNLQYVEAYAKHGYVGTVAGVNIYTSAIATKGKIVIATKKALTYFIKKGTQVEQDREKNIRKNTAYFRKYGVVALTDANYIGIIYK